MVTKNNAELKIHEGETYLITGATGFIGSSLVKYLCKLNESIYQKPCRIVILARNSDKAKKVFEDILDREYIQLIISDNKEEIKVLNEVDWIICAAAVTNKESFNLYPADTLVDNIAGIYNCLEFARNRKIKGLVFISSVLAYGQIEKDKLSEDDYGLINPMNTKLCYAISKQSGEMLCNTYRVQFGIPVKIVRLFHVYGEEEKYCNGTFFSDFMNNINQREDIEIKGTGKDIRNLCYIEDAIRGILCVLHKGIEGEVYNVASEKNNYSITEIGKMLCHIANKEGIKINLKTSNILVADSSAITKQIPDVSKLKQIGWTECSTDIMENFRKLIVKCKGDR